jgi:hypothetical protein
VLENKVIRNILASTHEVREEWGQKAGNYILQNSKILLFINYYKTINQEEMEGFRLW